MQVAVKLVFASADNGPRVSPMVQLAVPDNVRITSQALVADHGRIVVQPNEKTISWILEGCDPSTTPSLTGHIQTAVFQSCNPFPENGDYAERDAGTPLSTPYRQAHPLQAFLLFSVEGWSCSGLTLDRAVELAPNAASGARVAISASATSERVLLRQCVPGGRTPH